MRVTEPLGDAADDRDIQQPPYREPSGMQTRKLNLGDLKELENCYFMFDLEKKKVSESPTKDRARIAVRYFKVPGFDYVAIGELDKSQSIYFVPVWNELLKVIKDTKSDKDQTPIERITHIDLGAHLPTKENRENFVEAIRSGTIPEI